MASTHVLTALSTVAPFFIGPNSQVIGQGAETRSGKRPVSFGTWHKYRWRIGFPPLSAERRFEKSGSVAPLCPACHAVAAAGHHGCAHACQAPICTACSEARLDQRYCLDCLVRSLPITLFSASCRISRAYARRLPLQAEASCRSFHCGPALRTVDLFARYHCPCDTRHLVGCNGRQPCWSATQHADDPRPGRAVPLRRPVDHRRRSKDQQPAYVGVAHFGNPAEAGLTSCGMLPWHQAEPGGKVPRTLEGTDVVADRCRDQRRGDRPHARDRRK